MKKRLKSQIPLFSLLASALIVCISLAKPDSPAKSEAHIKQLIILTGDDINHASGTHEFEAGAHLLKKSLAASALKENIQTTLIHNWPEDPSVFDHADMIIHYYRGNKWHFVNQNRNLFQKLVDRGVSQMFIHYAVDPEKKGNTALKNWTGGYYKTKSSQNPHWTLDSQLKAHPINQGVEAYTLHDEWYFKIDFEDSISLDYKSIEKNRVYSVMSGDPSDHETNEKFQKALKKATKPSDLTVFWAKENTSGSRGIGVTGAHYHKNWAHDSFRKQILNSIAWGLHLDIPEQGLDSPPLNEDELNENLDKRKKNFQRITL